jgi:hypothetical protein
LLRAKDGGRYGFVGATYVHGIMRGEAMGGNMARAKVNIE